MEEEKFTTEVFSQVGVTEQWVIQDDELDPNPALDLTPPPLDHLEYIQRLQKARAEYREAKKSGEAWPEYEAEEGEVIISSFKDIEGRELEDEGEGEDSGFPEIPQFESIEAFQEFMKDGKGADEILEKVNKGMAAPSWLANQKDEVPFPPKPKKQKGLPFFGYLSRNVEEENDGEEEE
jgi:hypothetical protein